MSALLSPNTGASTVKTKALKPHASARLTRATVKSLEFITIYVTKK